MDPGPAAAVRAAGGLTVQPPPQGPKAISTLRAKHLRPTPVFDTYWRFASERQQIFFRRLSGHGYPWTEDPILRQYRFTNAYRASDRASQYLIGTVIPGSRNSADELVFRVLLFKLFNRITTWELLENRLGEIALGNFSVERYDGILSRAFAEGARLYSGAYIMPMPRLGRSRKHTNHLQLLDRMIGERLPQKLASARTMKAAYEMLLAYESLGPFLAYQYIIDLNYSWLFNFSEMDFVVAGPGAVDGIRKCFSHMGDLTFEEVIQATAEMAATAFESRDLNFLSLWGRPLQLIDCQNLYCEVDKYARLAHPEVKSRRVRLKRQYHPAPQEITLTYPSKWRLKMPERFDDLHFRESKLSR